MFNAISSQGKALYPHGLPQTNMFGEFEEKVKAILDDFGTGDFQRKNAAESYIARTPAIFSAMHGYSEVPAPKCVQIEITNRCSTGCRMCYRFTWTGAKGYPPERELSTQGLKDLFHDLYAAGVRTVIWTGGEPTTHPDFEELLVAAKKAGLKVGILSNGVGIDEKMAEAIVRNADFIRISQDDAPDGAGKTVRVVHKDYKSQHTLDVHAEQKKSLENLKAAQRKYPASQLKIGLAFTIQQGNVFDVPKMIRYASENEISLNLKIAHGAGAKHLCGEEELKWLQDTVLSDPAVIENPYVRGTISYLRNFYFRRLTLSDIACGLPTHGYYEKNKTICFTPYLFSLVDAFGEVHTCCHLYDDNGSLNSEQRKQYRLYDLTDQKGNVTQKFVDAWRSNRYDQMRQKLKPIDVNKMPCGNCTRHWIPNTILTRLYKEVFLPMVEKFGFEEGMTQYRSLVEKYPEEDVWF